MILNLIGTVLFIFLAVSLISPEPFPKQMNNVKMRLKELKLRLTGGQSNG